MKTPIQEDFTPTIETVKALMAWGVESRNPCGDKLIDQEFIEKQSIILEFIDYWKNIAPKSQQKKTNWQTTYRNYIKKIAWPTHQREFEDKRHWRSDSGSNGFQAFGDVSPDKPEKVAPRRKYKPIVRPSIEDLERMAGIRK